MPVCMHLYVHMCVHGLAFIRHKEKKTCMSGIVAYHFNHGQNIVNKMKPPAIIKHILMGNVIRSQNEMI